MDQKHQHAIEVANEQLRISLAAVVKAASGIGTAKIDQIGDDELAAASVELRESAKPIKVGLENASTCSAMIGLINAQVRGSDQRELPLATAGAISTGEMMAAMISSAESAPLPTAADPCAGCLKPFANPAELFWVTGAAGNKIPVCLDCRKDCSICHAYAILRAPTGKVMCMTDLKGLGLKPRACKKCGCTDGDCRRCAEKTGKACTWPKVDLCSACADAKTTKPKPAPKKAKLTKGKK